MASEYTVTFAAEIKQVGVKKTASLDKVYRVVLETNEPAVMNLDVFAADVLVDVTVVPQR